MPEAGIKQVKHRMFRSADVKVGLPNRLPFSDQQTFRVFGIQVAEVIPTGTGPLGHSVGLAGGRHPVFAFGLGSVREIDFPDCRSNQISNQSVIVDKGLSPVPAGW